MIGYKAFDKDLKCRGFQFEVGKTYSTGAAKYALKLHSDTVFHFCRELHKIDDESDYSVMKDRVCEIIATGDIVTDGNGNNYGTDEIMILREISREEIKKITHTNSGDRNIGDRNSGSWNIGDRNSGDRNSGDHNSGSCNIGDHNIGDHNIGDWNSGDHNSGDHNSGDHNSGDHNSGDWNSGDWNIGDRNIGDRNIGDRNIGNRNIGDHNSGSCNIGDRNSGDRNSGDHNSGSCNSGDRNIGDRNSGSWNSGDWNSGDRNSGIFNSDEPPLRIFNAFTDKKIDEIDIPGFLFFDLNTWVPSGMATEKEREAHKKEIEAAGGFLRSLGYKEAFRMAWDGADLHEHEKLLGLPNWNNKVFMEISGIDAEAEIEKERKKENEKRVIFV